MQKKVSQDIYQCFLCLSLCLSLYYIYKMVNVLYIFFILTGLIFLEKTLSNSVF